MYKENQIETYSFRSEIYMNIIGMLYNFDDNLISIQLTFSQVKHDTRIKPIFDALGSIKREYTKYRERIKW